MWRVEGKAEVDLLLMNIEKNKELGYDTGWQSSQSRKDPAYVEKRQRALNTMEIYSTLGFLVGVVYLILFFLPTITHPGGALYLIYACPLFLWVETLLDAFLPRRSAEARAVQKYLDDECGQKTGRHAFFDEMTVRMGKHDAIVAMLHVHRGDGYFGRWDNVVSGY
jgi:hypothetical protein